MEKQALAGRYALGERVGSGGMADVFTARDTRLERDVAIKLFRPGTADGLERGSAEARMLAGLDHPGLVRILDMDTGEHSDASAYLVMELVEGPDLREMLRIRGPLDRDEVLLLALDLARTLQYIHGRGIVHRDIKPSNILTRQADQQSGVFRYLLTDFGIARFYDGSRMTATGQVIGSAAYFSPEQTRGDGVGQPSDIYSFGLVLIEALTGGRAFPGTGIESALARLHRSPSIPHAAGPELAALLAAMTQDEPADRPDAAGLVRALTAGDLQRHDDGPTTTALSASAVAPATTALPANMSLPLSETRAVPLPATTAPSAPEAQSTALSATTALPASEAPTTALPATPASRTRPTTGPPTRPGVTGVPAGYASPAGGEASRADGGATGPADAAPLVAGGMSARVQAPGSGQLSASRPAGFVPRGDRDEATADRSGSLRQDVVARGSSAVRRRALPWLIAVLALVVLAAALWTFTVLSGGGTAPDVEPLPAVPGETGQKLQELYESVQR